MNADRISPDQMQDRVLIRISRGGDVYFEVEMTVAEAAAAGMLGPFVDGEAFYAVAGRLYSVSTWMRSSAAASLAVSSITL
jgi:hypothetical protein